MYTVAWLGCRPFVSCVLPGCSLRVLQRRAEREALLLAKTAPQAITLRQAVLAPLNKRNEKKKKFTENHWKLHTASA